MGDSVLNVALVGVGDVAMTVHLPTLLLHSDMFKTVALCDVSQQAVEYCAKRFHVAATFTSLERMLEQMPEIDLVFILSAHEFHVPQAVACLKAGKHVLIEKPMSLTKEGADEIEAARVESGKVAFVGYMRRYAEAFLQVKARVAALPREEINYVRVRDLIGQNHFFIDQSGTYPQKFGDIPSSSVEERAALAKQQLTTALGAKRAAVELDVQVYMFLNFLSAHDLSAMRELLGMPKRVLKATWTTRSQFLSVIFEYDGFVAYFETGWHGVRIFDAHIEVYATDQHIKVNYDTPFVKGLPITATIRSSKGETFSEETIRPTYVDAFTLEYQALYGAIVRGEEYKTTPLDAKQDLEMFAQIMDVIEYIT